MEDIFQHMINRETSLSNGSNFEKEGTKRAI